MHAVGKKIAKRRLSVSVTPTGSKLRCVRLLVNYCFARDISQRELKPRVSRQVHCIRAVLQFSASFARGASSSSTCLIFPLLVLPFAIFSPRFLCSAADHAPRGGIAMKSENIGERSDAHVAHRTVAVSSQLQLAQCSLKVPIGNGNSRSPGRECERTSETHSVTRIVYSGNRSALIIDRCIMFTEAIIAACTTPARDARRVTFAK